LVPTRELAVQICEEAEHVLEHSKRGHGDHGLFAVCFYGGGEKSEQLRKARCGCHVLVSTPGRLVDFIGSKEISLNRVSYFVLDEADKMLGQNFSHEVLGLVEDLPRDRRTIFFSATWPPEIEEMAVRCCSNSMGGSPIRINIGQDRGKYLKAPVGIRQEVICLDPDEDWDERAERKRKLLLNHCRNVLADEFNRVLVFVSERGFADDLRNTFRQEGVHTESMHGGHRQETRLAVVQRFRDAETRLLIATDVMGRGLDIPGVSHVVIYDMWDIEDYIHRIGRTARGPKGQGHALVFFDPDPKRHEMCWDLIKVLEESKQVVPQELFDYANSTRARRGRGNKGGKSWLHSSPRSSGWQW